jgi:SAM-dependent methyltransferase
MLQEPRRAAGGSWGKALRARKSALLFAAVRAQLRQAFRTYRLALRPYEPVEINGRVFPGRRTSKDRWEAIAGVLKDYAARNVLDVGCAEGWFLRRAATELGCYAIGVEVSERLLAGEIARLHDRIENMAIMLSRADAESLGRLPRFDAVICLSVVHHVIRHHGLDAAMDFVRALAGRAEKVIIFEMGTSEEKGLRWSGLLEEMPEGQEAYIRQFLERCGLRNVRQVASSSAFHGQANRLLFAGEPPAA